MTNRQFQVVLVIYDKINIEFLSKSLVDCFDLGDENLIISIS